MADDIKISGMNSQDGSQNPAQPAGQTAGNQAGGDQLNQVIDLRNIDQTSAQSGGTQGQAGGQAAGQSQTQGQGAPTGRRSQAIMLGDEEAGQTPAQDKYTIPSLVKEKFPDLIQLIKETESMNDEERDYWFQILPIMTEEQIRKFRDILVNEKAQLSNLDQEYEQELTKLNEKHMIEWKEFESKEKRKTLTTAEQTSKEKEKSEEEELLKRLSQV